MIWRGAIGCIIASAVLLAHVIPPMDESVHVACYDDSIADLLMPLQAWLTDN
jgi:hypothetical protein